MSLGGFTPLYEGELGDLQVNEVALSPQGSLFAVVENSNTYIFDVYNHGNNSTVTLPRTESLAFHPTKSEFCIALENELWIYSSENFEKQSIIALPHGVCSWPDLVTYSANGQFIACASISKVCVFKLNRNKYCSHSIHTIESTLKGPLFVNGLCFNPTCTEIAVACDGQKMRVIDLRSKTVRGIPSVLKDAEFMYPNQSQSHVLTLLKDGGLMRWNISDFSSEVIEAAGVTTCAFAMDSYVYCSQAVIYHSSGNRVELPANITCLTMLDNNIVFAGTECGRIYKWDVDENCIAEHYSGTSMHCEGLRITSDSRVIFIDETRVLMKDC
ncbi:hypothetical protein PCE1_004879 [Barthelona sp. PCE]